MKKYQVKLTLTAPLLGTVAKDHEVRELLAAAVLATHEAVTTEQTEEEEETAPAAEEKPATGFHSLPDGQPFLYDYVIKGFAKDSCSMLRRAAGTGSSKLAAHKKVIDGLLFVHPRRLPLVLPAGAEMGVLERPLRAQTAKGERIALARSDTVPEGTTLAFEVLILGAIERPLLEEWLTYGALRGLGQWRNAGFGCFTYEIKEV